MPVLAFFKSSLCLALALFSLCSQALSLIPDEIDLPPRLKNRSADQIKAVFSSLERQNRQKTANLWRLRYQKALLLKNKDTNSFCRIMKELGETPLFPLKDLALIQGYELCPFPAEPEFEPDSVPEWLRLSLAEAFYKRRKLFANPRRTLKAVVFLAQNSPYKDLKISYLKHALALAKEPGDEGEIQTLRELLYKESPSLQPQIPPEDWLLAAEDFRRRRKLKQAIEFYIKVLNSPSGNFKEKDLAFAGLDRVYRIQRDRRGKIINSRQWSKWLLREGTEQSLRAYYKRRLELARQEWNRNENQKAIQLATEVLQDPESAPVRGEALYLRGLIYAQEKREDLSLSDWDQAIESLKGQKGGKRGLLGKILWKKAWLLRGQKKYQEAFDSLQLLEKINKNPYTRYKLLFWKGKTLQDLGKSAQAKREFKLAAQKDPFGYYGLLAHKALGKRPAFQKREEPFKKSSFLSDQKMENLIYWLILFEESSLLSQFLDRRTSKFLGRKRQTEKDWLKAIRLWGQAKKYLNVFQSLEKMDERLKHFFLKRHIHFFFPLDFFEDVEKASSRWNVPMALIFAIVRQESAFNVRARSPADAFGLMQLIPSTARQTARKFKIPYRNFRNLYHPSKNIFLGTAHLRRLLDQYDNNFIFAVSAYNAGGTPLNRWREKLKGLDPLEFVENIPYEETRVYARLVIRNYVFYHNELNEGEEDWFPDWPLQPSPSSGS